MKHSTTLDIQKSAVLSECEQHRFELRRIWDEPLGLVNIIGLNPSTADATQDDPTIRRCIQFAKSWGYGGLIMTNLFSLRLTDSKRLHLQPATTLLGNWSYALDAAREARIVVAAWGNHKMARIQGEQMVSMLNAWGMTLHCIQQTKPGVPWHPLYLKGDLKPRPFEQ